VVEGIRKRYSLAVAEVAHQDTWQRATIGVVALSGEASHAVDQIDAAERFVWSFPEIQVLSSDRHWLEID